ncbi:TPA: hypothetical protein QDB06_003608 [Burkholderia vietnamiensis]|nr:hypothetical protein [Burkholderia vietnamiensis]
MTFFPSIPPMTIAFDVDEDSERTSRFFCGRARMPRYVTDASTAAHGAVWIGKSEVLEIGACCIAAFDRGGTRHCAASASRAPAKKCAAPAARPVLNKKTCARDARR